MPADKTSDENNQGHAILVKAYGFGKSFDGERTIGVDLVVTGFVRLVSGIHQFLGGIELRHQSIDRRIGNQRVAS